MSWSVGAECGNNIVSRLRPNIITLNETHFTKKKKLKLQGYESFTKSRIDTGGGGVATACINGDADFALKISEGEGNDEFIITRHSQFYPAINVINVYGESECRNRNDEIEERFHRLLHELRK